MSDEEGFGRRTDGPTGRRRAPRERVSLPVSLYSVDQSRVALLVDISQLGCRLHGIGLPQVGTDVLLKAAEVELFGRIIWKGKGERGVEFYEPVSDANLSQLRDSSCPDVIPPEGCWKPLR